MVRPVTPLWRCPRCGQAFTVRNQWHSCGAFDLEAHFAKAQPHVREIFDRLVAIARANGPVRVIPQKTRIAFQVRMRFAAVMPRRDALAGHLVLARPHRAPCFLAVTSISPRNHLHTFTISRVEELDRRFSRFVAAAYRVGCQEHLHRDP
jgi:hypothetical protein